MLRPCFLVIDREFAGNISTRKLVIETAKLNVITAYSGAEAVETLRKFPAVNGVVMDADVDDIPCETLIATLKGIVSSIPIVLVRTPKTPLCAGADYYLGSFDPAAILELLKKLEPEETAGIQAHDDELAEEK